MRRIIIFISFLLVSNLSALAQTTQINSDRLNFMANTSLVSKGTYQLEAGYFLTKTKFTKFNNYYAQLPSTLQRYGLSNRVELRLSIVSAAVFARNNDSYKTNYYISGLEGPEIGAKIKILEQKKIIPTISVLPAIKFQPFASPKFKSKNIRPSLQLLMAHDLPAQISLGYNFCSSWDKKMYYNYNLFAQKKWGNKFITTLSYSHDWFAPDETRPNKQKRIGSSIAYYFHDNIIADFGLGWGVENAPDNYYKVGVSFAF